MIQGLRRRLGGQDGERGKGTKKNGQILARDRTMGFRLKATDLFLVWISVRAAMSPDQGSDKGSRRERLR